MWGIAAVILLLLQVSTVYAHEVRPAYLDMRETAAQRYDVLWKVPALGGKRLGLYVQLPSSCISNGEPRREISGDAYLEHWNVTCIGGLKGGEIAVDGLAATMTDVLVRIAYADGTTEIGRLRPDQTVLEVKGPQTALEVAVTYTRLGIDHILSGIDHLLFVLALMLLIRNPWMLVKTITAFTVAHSITLAGAALGYFSLPQKPVEAVIALSIVFVASELIKAKAGERCLSEDYPWVVAFTFGLLHGFGFAGALQEIGLPQADVPLALLTFNLGVEFGQLLFVAAVLIIILTMRLLVKVPHRLARVSAAYVIGMVATVWFFERIASFVTL
jgi:hydrogenase/urease accessory protein HupE